MSANGTIPTVQKRTMKAIVHTRYGSPEVLQLKEVETPVPQEEEVLVRVHAASVNASDWHAMRGKPIRTWSGGLRTPNDQHLGGDLAGRVEAVGPNVTQFQALLLGPVMSKLSSKKLGAFVADPVQPDLLVLTELLEAGKVVPVIDQRYTLSETREAMRYLEGGHARGKVVITV